MWQCCDYNLFCDVNMTCIGVVDRVGIVNMGWEEKGEGRGVGRKGE